MSWKLRWHPAALHGFYSLPMDRAKALDAALIRFVETGQGDVRRAKPENPYLFEIRVPGATALFYEDAETMTLHVTCAFRRG